MFLLNRPEINIGSSESERSPQQQPSEAALQTVKVKLTEQLSVTAVTNPSLNVTAAPTTTQPTTATGTIPQDIATMSDHDLISYINPSCFDQGISLRYKQFNFFFL